MKQQMMTPQQFKAAYEQEAQTRMEQIDFPRQYIPFGFDKWLTAALMLNTPKALNIPWDIYKKLYRFEGATVAGSTLNCYEMGFAINAIEHLRPVDVLDLGQEYVAIIDAVREMGITWNKLTEPARSAAMRKVESLGKSGIVLPGKGGKA